MIAKLKRNVWLTKIFFFYLRWVKRRIRGPMDRTSLHRRRASTPEIAPMSEVPEDEDAEDAPTADERTMENGGNEENDDDDDDDDEDDSSDSEEDGSEDEEEGEEEEEEEEEGGEAEAEEQTALTVVTSDKGTSLSL